MASPSLDNLLDALAATEADNRHALGDGSPYYLVTRPAPAQTQCLLLASNA